MPNPTFAITNLGKIVTGDIDRPVAEGDTIIVRDEKIAAVGNRKDLEPESADVFVDAGGMTAMPGLIDPHIHPMLGDWSPRHSVMGLLEGAMHGGVTSMLSQGIVHMEGRPRDRTVPVPPSGNEGRGTPGAATCRRCGRSGRRGDRPRWTRPAATPPRRA